MKVYTRYLRRRRRPWPAFLDPRMPLTTQQAAAYLGLCPRTLYRWRKAGIGPDYIKPATTEWHVVWYVGFALVRWQAEQLGEPVPSLDELMERWVAAMRAAGVPALPPLCSLTARPFRLIERWRPKGMRKCKRRRSKKSHYYVSSRANESVSAA